MQLYAQEDTEYDKYFQMSLEELMNIEVVTARSKSEKMVDAPLNIIAITGDEMRSRGYRTLYDLARDLPGAVRAFAIGYSQNGSQAIRGIGGTGRLNLASLRISFIL